jgi:hypothetical protein
MDGQRPAVGAMVLLAALVWGVAAWFGWPVLAEQPPGWVVWHRVGSVALGACATLYLHFTMQFAAWGGGVGSSGEGERPGAG